MTYTYVAALHASQVSVFHHILRDARYGKQMQWDEDSELSVIPFDCSDAAAGKLKQAGISFTALPDL